MDIEDLFDQYYPKIIQDIDYMKMTIQDVVESLGNLVDYAYFKGSAVKPIESYLDYTPLLSDIDFHLMTTSELFEFGLEGMDKSVQINIQLNETYFRYNPTYSHIPRVQLVYLNDKIGSFTEVAIPEEHIIVGLIPVKQSTKEDLISQDKSLLLDNEGFLKSFAYSFVDRNGIDYWSLLRRMVYRISPSVNRLLSLHTQDPETIWSMNRTRLLPLLNDYNPKISVLYQRYYELGWRLFYDNYQNYEIYTQLLQTGYTLIFECYRIGQTLV